MAMNLLWLLLGMLLGLVAAGARVWARDLGLVMTWWKWLLAALWYGGLLLTVAAPMTLAGEQEAGAGLRLLLVMGVILIILGAGLWRLLTTGRRAEP